MVCILLNTLAMCFEHYSQSKTHEKILNYIEYFFITIFTIECIIKLIALNWKYFKVSWLIVDFIIVVSSVLSIYFETLIKKYTSFSPALLQVVRLTRLGRILRLIKGTEGLRTLIYAVFKSVVSLINIGLFLFLIIFIYAILGMNFFMHVKHYDAGITGEFNFENIYRSMITLFPLCTSGGWSVLLHALTNENQPDCDPNKNSTSLQLTRGDCGSSVLATIFLVSYVVITFFVVINMYVAIILDNFSEAKEDVKQGFTRDDIERYNDIWVSFDPKCTEYISFDKLSEFVDSLQNSPLRIPSPNRDKLISMDIHLYENDLVYYSDVFEALLKNYICSDVDLGSFKFEEIIKLLPKEFRVRKKGLNPKSSTLIKYETENS